MWNLQALIVHCGYQQFLHGFLPLCVQEQHPGCVVGRPSPARALWDAQACDCAEVQPRPATQDETEGQCLLTGQHAMRKLAKQEK